MIPASFSLSYWLKEAKKMSGKAFQLNHPLF